MSDKANFVKLRLAGYTAKRAREIIECYNYFNRSDDYPDILTYAASGNVDRRKESYYEETETSQTSRRPASQSRKPGAKSR